MEEKKLIMTVGLPRSGKSTWCREFFSKVPVISPDVIRRVMYNERFIAEREPDVWLATKAMIRSLFRTGWDVMILDSCQVTAARRSEWIDPEWERRFKLFKTLPGECIARAEHARDMEIIPVIQKMSIDWQDLTDEEFELILTPEEESLLLTEGRF